MTETVGGQAGLVRQGASGRNSWHVSGTRVTMLRDRRAARPQTLSDRGRAITFDLSRTAIIVIDMQNDFCHPEGWLGHIGVDVALARRPIEPIAALLPKLRQADVPVIWVNWGNRPDRANLAPNIFHVYDASGTGIGLGQPLPGSGAAVLEAGSWSAQIVDELEVTATDIRIDKFSMSGFHDTVLDSVLRNLDVTTVLFAGVNADQCVLCTLQDASFKGYDCILLEECCGTTSPDYCMQATLYNVRQCFGFVCSSNELTESLDPLEKI